VLLRLAVVAAATTVVVVLVAGRHAKVQQAHRDVLSVCSRITPRRGFASGCGNGVTPSVTRTSPFRDVSLPANLFATEVPPRRRTHAPVRSIDGANDDVRFFDTTAH
jgi:hypothetical protein